MPITRNDTHYEAISDGGLLTSLRSDAAATKPSSPNLTFACAVKRRWSSVGRETHPGTGSLHPVAIGAVVEVTKLLKPLV